jgi:hypothetical protein
LHLTPQFDYGVYGISLRSDIPLALPLHHGPALATIELRGAPPERFSTANVGAELHTPADWYQFAHLDDGSYYVRWSDLGQFLVAPDGALIHYHRGPAAPLESFQVYLLNQAISFALVQQGFEPLHATTVLVDGHAIALLGDSGYGKSTLAAAFLKAGHELLTDDLLLLRQVKHGLEAFPGPPRIKLFPDTARRLLRTAADDVPMNSGTRKQVIPLGHRKLAPIPLRAIYVLAPPHEMRLRRTVCIEPLAPREAFLALVANTFNRCIGHSGRLRRQISANALLMAAIPVKKLSYPRTFAGLPQVLEAILADSPIPAGRLPEQAIA